MKRRADGRAVIEIRDIDLAHGVRSYRWFWLAYAALDAGSSDLPNRSVGAVHWRRPPPQEAWRVTPPAVDLDLSAIYSDPPLCRPRAAIAFRA
jgi:hypothetical protein